MSSQPPPPNDPPSATQEPAIRFRPGKKRKVYRQRDETPPPSTTTSAPAGSASPLPPRDAKQQTDDDDEDGGASSAAVRLRNARKHRAGGVGFGSRDGETLKPSSASAGTDAVVPFSQDASDAAVAYGLNRFTQQTGLVSSLNDRHMYVPPFPMPILLSEGQDFCASQLIIQDGIHRIPPLPPFRNNPR